jgi:hypothetical protein
VRAAIWLTAAVLGVVAIGVGVQATAGTNGGGLSERVTITYVSRTNDVLALRLTRSASPFPSGRAESGTDCLVR